MDIPVRQILGFLEALSEGSIKSIKLADQEPVPLFRHGSQAEALRDVVGKVRLLQVTEGQRGLVAMMAFYLRVAALQKIRVTFYKEAYPILGRCSFAAWLKLVGDKDFNGRLKDLLRQVTGLAIDGKSLMIAADKCPEGKNQQNPFREEWVDSVLTGADEKLMLNTKHGWWPIKGELLTFELRGLPEKVHVDEWRPLLVGLYDWFHELLAEGALNERGQPAAAPLVPRVMPPVYYEMKEQGRLTQEMINRAERLRTDKASHGEIDRFLRQEKS